MCNPTVCLIVKYLFFVCKEKGCQKIKRIEFPSVEKLHPLFFPWPGHFKEVLKGLSLECRLSASQIQIKWWYSSIPCLKFQKEPIQGVYYSPASVGKPEDLSQS